MNRIEVIIDGITYTVLSDESQDYIRKNAQIVDDEIREIKALSGYSALSAAVLTAMNMADKYHKEAETSDGLRLQIKEYAEECSRLQAELSKKKKA